MKRLTALLAALACLGAGPLGDEDPAGTWEFRTDIRNKGCTIVGFMTIGIEDPVSGGRSCSFVSSETCGPFDPEPVKMEQACSVARDGDFVLIRSRVVASLTEGRGIGGYLPDHFTVEPSGPGRMSGVWFDENYADQVEFWRSRGGASS